LSLLLVLILATRVFSEHSGFPPSIKINISKFQIDLDVKCLHMSPWLGRLRDYSLTMTLNLIYHLPEFVNDFIIFPLLSFQAICSSTIII